MASSGRFGGAAMWASRVRGEAERTFRVQCKFAVSYPSLGLTAEPSDLSKMHADVPEFKTIVARYEAFIRVPLSGKYEFLVDGRYISAKLFVGGKAHFVPFGQPARWHADSGPSAENVRIEMTKTLSSTRLYHLVMSIESHVRSRCDRFRVSSGKL
jgi:hypothetical protein